MKYGFLYLSLYSVMHYIGYQDDMLENVDVS